VLYFSRKKISKIFLLIKKITLRFKKTKTFFSKKAERKKFRQSERRKNSPCKKTKKIFQNTTKKNLQPFLYSTQLNYYYKNYYAKNATILDLIMNFPIFPE